MATDNVTIIGKGSRVRGRITGAANLEIYGLVEGEILVQGDLTVGDTGMVASDLSGRRVVVRGAVKGNISGEESVFLEDGAKVVGDVRAPRVAIGKGALVRGYVQTAGAEGTRPRSAAKPASATKPAARPAHVPVPVRAARPAASPPRGATLAGTNHAPKKGPPQPVVPALRKGAKGALSKKR